MIFRLPNRASIRFICMILSLATSRRLLVSSHLLAPEFLRFANSVGRQHCCRRHHHRWARLAFISNNPRRANSPRYPGLRSRISMSPSSGMSTLPMSAVEEASSTNASPNKTFDTDKAMIAKRVSATLPSLYRCGERLRAGELVSFPTETVYGLGCHALDPIAVQKVFDAKERPLSDPLIVHVTKSEDALGLWAASSSADDETVYNARRHQIEKKALATLTRAFFPGPLTLVARARPAVPQILMAGTGYVACRSPSHSVARALIDAAGVPIAAPSANKFGHVSPTLAAHVLDDLGGEDVWVVDPNLGNEEECANNGKAQDGNVVCQVGVESTVAKIEVNTDSSSSDVVGSITILRHGAISSRSIRETLEEANLARYFDVSDSVKFTSEKVHNVAPGQTVKHYSPNVPCFMIGPSRQSRSQSEEPLGEKECAILSGSVIVDYGRRLVRYRPHALGYRDLSPEGDPSTAAFTVFETLRWSETVDGAMRVFVPELVLGDEEGEGQQYQALVLAVKDKLTRAASAVVVDVFQ